MKPSRELDWLIMEKVLGRDSCGLTDAATFDNALDHVPEYSAEITAAWDVVEKLRLAVIPGEDGKWRAVDFEFIPDCVYYETNLSLMPPADTAAFAICLAALAVKEIIVWCSVRNEWIWSLDKVPELATGKP